MLEGTSIYRNQGGHCRLVTSASCFDFRLNVNMIVQEEACTIVSEAELVVERNLKTKEKFVLSGMQVTMKGICTCTSYIWYGRHEDDALGRCSKVGHK